MNLYHYSREPLGKLENRDQLEYMASGIGKPCGFWLSVDDVWAKFLKSQGRLAALLYLGKRRYDVTLKPKANVLHISTAAELDAFTAAFRLPEGAEPLYVENLLWPSEYGVERDDAVWIDWPRVARAYAGLIISPFIEERYDYAPTFWYRGWDVASACIWDVSAIQSAKLVGEETRHEAVSRNEQRIFA